MTYVCMFNPLKYCIIKSWILFCPVNMIHNNSHPSILKWWKINPQSSHKHVNFFMNSLSTIKYTVESSLFVGDQCLWISWATFIHEFTSIWACYTDMNCVIVKCIMNQTSYSRNYVPLEPVKSCLSLNFEPCKLKSIVCVRYVHVLLV